MTVKDFDKLITKDFKNGAILDEIRASLKELEKLKIALSESLILQKHYAMLLNQMDGGKRYIFKTPESWVARLIETGVIKK